MAALLVYMCVYVCMMGVRMEPITGTGGGSMDGTLVFSQVRFFFKMMSDSRVEGEVSYF